MKLFLLGLVVQLVFLVSVFDIYLKTKVVVGVKPEESCRSGRRLHYGPAKRLVLIVSDGLRADVLFTAKEELALRKIITESGRWGISKAKVPTRSLQGLLAIGSGIYSDPLAFLDIWQRWSPRPDTVFDRASHVFYFGHPGVPDYFTTTRHNWYVMPSPGIDWKKLRPGRSAAHLDEYVLDRFSEFLRRAEDDSRLKEKLTGAGVLLVVYLSGVDKAGHQGGALSKAARDNVLAVDRGVVRVQRELERFYDDRETAYVFTSDHGATDWGSHGGSSPAETDTPLIVWGPGVGPPTWDGDPGSSPSDWNMGRLTRRDVRQVDLAPLMATLLGVPVPVNSIGTLADGYLDSAGLKAEGVACNALQLANLAAASRWLVRGGIFASSEQLFTALDNRTLSDFAKNISESIARSDYDLATAMGRQLMTIASEAFHFYHGFFTSPLYALVIASFVAWTLVLLSYMLPGNDLSGHSELCTKCQAQEGRATSDERKEIPRVVRVVTSAEGCISKLVHATFIAICVSTIAILALNDWPINYYVYVVLAVALWWIVMTGICDWIKFFVGLNLSKATVIFSYTVIYAMVVEFLLWSIKVRYPLSLALVLVAFLPSFKPTMKNIDPFLIFLWFTSAAALEGLLFHPVIGLPTNTLVLILSLTAIIIVGAVFVHVYSDNGRDYVLGVIGLLFVGLALFVLEAADSRVRESGNTSSTIRALSWAITYSVFPMPVLGSKRITNRLFLLAVYYTVPVLLLSTRHEPLALLVLYIHTACWLVFETRASKVNNLSGVLSSDKAVRPLNVDDARRAAVLLFYTLFSYIVMGNYDDISSFDLQSLRCFTTELDEILMGFLLMLKFFLVFVVLVGGHSVLSSATGADTSRPFALVILLANFLGFRMFFEFSESGTQQEISRHLSHHCFAQAFICLLILSYILARILLFSNPLSYFERKNRREV